MSLWETPLGRLQPANTQPADAIPKKRGPKTDVLEALLKRVDGLEKRLVTEGKSDDLIDPHLPQDPSSDAAVAIDAVQPPSRPHHEPASTHAHATNHASQLMSPIEPRYPLPLSHAKHRPVLTVVSAQTSSLAPDLLVDTYFARIHGKPYYILDETTTRQRLQTNQLPNHLAFALYAVSAR